MSDEGPGDFGAPAPPGELGPRAPLAISDLVTTLGAVRATRSRTAKIEALAALFARTLPDEAEAVVGLLLGRIRQGRIGLGWRTLQAATADQTATAEQTAGGSPKGPLSVAAVDRALGEIAALSGPGSAGRRQELVGALLSPATDSERDLLVAAILGDVRTGALDGVLTDALARAVARPLAQVRRAVMLEGDLGRTAAMALRDPSRLATVALRAGTPVQPMLASTAADVTEALAGVLASPIRGAEPFMGVEALADYLIEEYGELDSDYVFVNLWGGRVGSPLKYAAVYDLVRRLRARTGIDFDPHWLRHTYATGLLRSDVPVEVVSSLLGHASVATTSSTYAHLTVADTRAALTRAGVLTEDVS